MRSPRSIGNHNTSRAWNRYDKGHLGWLPSKSRNSFPSVARKEPVVVVGHLSRVHPDFAVAKPVSPSNLLVFVANLSSNFSHFQPILWTKLGICICTIHIVLWLHNTPLNTPEQLTSKNQWTNICHYKWTQKLWCSVIECVWSAASTGYKKTWSKTLCLMPKCTVQAISYTWQIFFRLRLLLSTLTSILSWAAPRYVLIQFPDSQWWLFYQWNFTSFSIFNRDH